MIALDTNVVLRYLLEDDPVQSPKAARLFAGNRRVLLTDVVLAEIVWTVSGRKYRFEDADIADLVGALFAEPGVRFEDDQVVWRTLSDFRDAIGASGARAKRRRKAAQAKRLGFVDALIANKAAHVARQAGRPLEALYTFDSGLRRLAVTRSP